MQEQAKNQIVQAVLNLLETDVEQVVQKELDNLTKTRQELALRKRELDKWANDLESKQQELDSVETAREAEKDKWYEQLENVKEELKEAMKDKVAVEQYIDSIKNKIEEKKRQTETRWHAIREKEEELINKSKKLKSWEQRLIDDERRIGLIKV